jgi:hypothetical protein
LSGSITFADADFSTNVTIVPIDDAFAEVTETVTLSINPSPNYVGAGSATVTIADNETPQLAITNLSSQMYERTNDYAAFQITRLGDTNAAAFPVNLSFAGTAVFGADFYTNSDVLIEPGVQATTFNILPVVDSTHEGNEQVIVTLATATGGEYTVGAADSASATLVDADVETETVLFSENFDTDHSANWTMFFAANDGTPDFTVDFNFPYPSFGIPEAPRGGGNGLFMNVNKDATGSATALNFYPNGQNFSGNFALRFDMFLSVQLPSTVATEHVLAGINHSGTKTNWWRSGGVPAGWTFDGLFFALESDNQSSPNYAVYSLPTTTGNNPTLLASQTAAAVAGVFKAPPWGVAGTPGNINNPPGVFATPIWADVEISQLGGVVTLKINNTTIISFNNTNAQTAGNILLGYLDAFDSASPGQSYVVFDNVRVVRLEVLGVFEITQFQDLGATFEMDFTAPQNDPPSAFDVQAAATVNGTYADTAATIVEVSPANYRATVTKNGNAQFYRIRRN